MPTYHIGVEWVSGSFTEIRDDAVHLTISRELSDIFRQLSAGELNVEVMNVSGKYVPDNGASPFSPNILPNKRIRVFAIDGGTTYHLFHGFLDEISVDGSDKNSGRATLRARDLVRNLRGRTINTSYWINFSVGSVFAEVLSLAGVSSLQIDEIPDQTPTAWWRDAPVETIVSELLALGYYKAYVNRSGVLRVRNRYYDQSSGTTIGSYAEFYGFGYSNTDDQIINEVFLESLPREKAAAISTLSYINPELGGISIAASAHVAFVMEFLNATSRKPVQAVDLIVPVQSSDWVAGRLQFTGTSTLSLAPIHVDATSTTSVAVLFHAQTVVSTVFNGSADTVYLNKYQVRGNEILEIAKFGVRTENASSQAVFGRKTFALTSDKLSNDRQYLRDYSDFLIDRFRNPTPNLLVSIRNKFPDILKFDVGEIIDVVNSFAAVGSKHVITRLDHDIDITESRRHTTTVVAERLRVYQLFTLDDSTLGALDSGNTLGF